MAGHKQACGWVLIALQIRLIDSPTERTTAATDALLALLALSSIFYLNYFRQNDPWKVSLWS
jgi:uncharacterized membrane protein